MTDEAPDAPADDDEWEYAELIDEVAEGERPCPVCAVAMRVERKQGVSIDVCADHGCWLDHNELDAILSRLQNRGRRRRRAAIRRAEAKLQAMQSTAGIWGVLAALHSH